MSATASSAFSSPPVVERAVASSLVFAEVYREHFTFVWRSTRALGVNASAVDDAVQEIFVTVHRRLAEFEGRSSVRTWLSGIIVNVVRHHRRSIQRRSPHELPGAATDDPELLPTRARGPQEDAELAEDARLLQALLDTLDDDKREVLVLAELEELSVPEIARSLGLNVNTAYSRLRLAREQFDKALARHRAHVPGRGR
jgi:RNA polymerase sigma-70 factor, ECF subfamily